VSVFVGGLVRGGLFLFEKSEDGGAGMDGLNGVNELRVNGKGERDSLDGMDEVNESDDRAKMIGSDESGLRDEKEDKTKQPK
jgi:hypothetical protein